MAGINAECECICDWHNKENKKCSEVIGEGITRFIEYEACTRRLVRRLSSSSSSSSVSSKWNACDLVYVIDIYKVHKSFFHHTNMYTFAGFTMQYTIKCRPALVHYSTHALTYFFIFYYFFSNLLLRISNFSAFYCWDFQKCWAIF